MIQEGHIFKMAADDLTVTEIMKLVNKTVVERLQRGIAGQFNFNRGQISQGGFNRGLIGFQGRYRTIAEVIIGVCLRGRKPEISGSFQGKQQFPASHVFEAAIKLDPVPVLAENS